MFYNSNDVEETLKCSFCRIKFKSVIKLIPECGESICGDCYAELKDCEKFKCESDTCQEVHSMPKNGLPDNKGLLRLLEKQKVEKPLSEKAKELKVLVNSIKDQLQDLKSFDARDRINQHCDQLESEVVEEIASVFKELDKIQEDLLQKIKKYREESLKSVSNQPKAHTDEKEKELAMLSHNIKTFGDKWNDYFSRVEALASDNEIQAALVEAKEFESRMDLFKSQLKRNSFNGNLMEFKSNSDLNVSRETLRSLFSLSNDTSVGDLRIDETPSYTLTGHTDDVIQVIFLGNDQVASCSKDKTIKVWNVKNGSMIYELKGHTHWVCSVCLLENGLLASGSVDKTIKIWNLAQRKEVRTLKGHTDTVATVRTLKNGNLVSYSCDDTMRIWNPYLSDAKKNLVLTITGHGNTYWAVSFFTVLANDNLVTLSRDKECKEECVMRIWSSSDGQLVKSISTGFPAIMTVSTLPNDQLAVGYRNGTIKIYHMATLDAQPTTKEKAHDGYVASILQLSNGNLVFFGETQSAQTIKVWNSIDMSLLQTIKTGHKNVIDCLSISPDERLLASASRDKTIKLWTISKNP